jgi:hypothetical protein
MVIDEIRCAIDGVYVAKDGARPTETWDLSDFECELSAGE